MRNKVYKRHPIKLWENDCGGCCVICGQASMCRDSCFHAHITCNQCDYSSTSSKEEEE